MADNTMGVPNGDFSIAGSFWVPGIDVLDAYLFDTGPSKGKCMGCSWLEYRKRMAHTSQPSSSSNRIYYFPCLNMHCHLGHV